MLVYGIRPCSPVVCSLIVRRFVLRFLNFCHLTAVFRAFAETTDGCGFLNGSNNSAQVVMAGTAIRYCDARLSGGNKKGGRLRPMRIAGSKSVMWVARSHSRVIGLVALDPASGMGVDSFDAD